MDNVAIHVQGVRVCCASCRYCKKNGDKKAECRKMKADLAASRCDESGKPTGVNSLTVTGATQRSSQATSAPSAVC